MKISDFRSDTVTRPTEPMRRVMIEAPLGDDVYGEDPSVNQLEARCGALFGKEAALWLPTGTQANLVAILTHCQRGDEYIVGQEAHCYRYEGGGAAVCGGVQPQPLVNRPDGTLDLDEVEAVIKPRDYHFARTRLLCLENTRAGVPLPIQYTDMAGQLCKRYGLSMHLDGARLFNAAIACGLEVHELAQVFDSVTLCLSKGLGAPAGTVLVGKKDFVDEARRWRKVLGGGLRQAGVLASAGMYALENHVARLAEDHLRARTLALGLSVYPELNVDIDSQSTNMVFAAPELELSKRYQEYLGQHHVLVGGYGKLRFVTHMDVGDEDVDRVLKVSRDFFQSC